ncbi:MAG TPA: phosphatase PAP2 family protein, partial [Myxococcales bacterium]|nr:phosphatase PAP2 family protein [Myxococcales bacterium]
MFRPAAVVVLGVVVSAAPGGAYAQEKPNVADGWPATWNRVGPVETAAIGLVGVGLLVNEFAIHSPATPRWTEPILFDSDARTFLRASSPGGRSRAATASDVGYIGISTYAVAVEAGLVTWLGHGKGDAALQLALINVEALAINGLVTRVTQRAVGRQRPDFTPTTTDNTSFYSGHTSTAFTVASSLCVQHSRLRIYGNVADDLACPLALTVATATGLLRIVADRHWASDVLAGAAAGTAVGATVSLLHLRNGSAPVASSFSLGAGGQALVYGGRF